MSAVMDHPTRGTQRADRAAIPSRWGLIGKLFILGVRGGIAVLLCTQFITSVLVVGWTFRWMQRNIVRGWYRRNSAAGEKAWTDLIAELDESIPVGWSPHWIVHEHARSLVRGQGRRSLIARGRDLFRAGLGGLFANVRWSVMALLCTGALTLPGLVLMWLGWEYGWLNSFYKGYEQAFFGRLTFIVGALMFVGAMLYVPMAWCHLAASGDPRAFFQFRLVGRLIRARLARLTLFAALFSLLMMPASLAWLRIYSITNERPELETASVDVVHRFTEGYVRNTAMYVLPAYVLLHLLVARIYQGVLPRVLNDEPKLIEGLPRSLHRTLDRLEMLPESARRRRHPFVAAVIGTSRASTNALLWVASFLLWLTVVAQMLVTEFIHYHPFLIWLNPWFVHLPCPRWG